MPRHFLRLTDLTREELHGLLDRALEIKRGYFQGVLYQPLRGATLAMLFDKASTRTRVSFEAAISQFGGHALFLSHHDSQLGRGEPVADSARVISSMVDVLVIRTYQHRIIEEFAGYSSVPVINALTDLNHPCQLLADMLTWLELRGPIAGKTAAWIGDGNNVCYSWMNAARLFQFQLKVAAPAGFEPPAEHCADCAEWVSLVADPAEAVTGVDLVVTDVWSSMGQEAERDERKRAFRDYQVTQRLMDRAKPEALFMHCLPAHRGEEVSGVVLDGPQSVVWQEAENRLHAQKALLEFLLVPGSNRR